MQIDTLCRLFSPKKEHSSDLLTQLELGGKSMSRAGVTRVLDVLYETRESLSQQIRELQAAQEQEAQGVNLLIGLELVR